MNWITRLGALALTITPFDWAKLMTPAQMPMRSHFILFTQRVNAKMQYHCCFCMVGQVCNRHWYTNVTCTHCDVGSVYDFHKVIPKLVKPDNEGLAWVLQSGYHATDNWNLLANRFHVVVPSLPGYFLSGHPQRQGWTVINTANVFNRLMVNILGYEKYAVQGGDWVRSRLFNVTPPLAKRSSSSLYRVHL